MTIVELQHIWTDSRRKLSTFNDTMLLRDLGLYGRWESTGELVSEIDANFHVPWYSTGQCHNNDANCLNLDHTDYIPIIYGLSPFTSYSFIGYL